MPQYQLEKNFAVEVGYLDARGIARPSAIVDFMQEIATRHADEMGLSHAAMERCNAFWVLTRLKYYMTRPLKQYEVVHVTTWPRKIRGALFYRDFRFRVGGEEVGHAVTAWSVISMDTHHLIRPASVLREFPVQEDGIDEMLTPIRCDGVEPCFVRRVHYSDIDVNRHLNNVKAVDILSDAIGLETHENWFVSELQVNYKAETACGTDLTLLRERTGEELCLQAKADEQEKLQAKVKIATF